MTSMSAWVTLRKAEGCIEMEEVLLSLCFLAGIWVGTMRERRRVIVLRERAGI